MMEFVLQYGLFVAKTVTVVVAMGFLIALAANLNTEAIARATSSSRPWLKGDQHGCVLRLSPDGRKAQFPIAAVGSAANDLAIDAADNLYVAADDGIVAVSGLVDDERHGSALEVPVCHEVGR